MGIPHLTEADIKTVDLDGTETRVNIIGRHCNIYNYSNEMVYAAYLPGIVPEAGGVLSVHPNEIITFTDICGVVYLKGTGRVQLVGLPYDAVH